MRNETVKLIKRDVRPSITHSLLVIHKKP